MVSLILARRAVQVPGCRCREAPSGHERVRRDRHDLGACAAGERKTVGREALATRSPDGLDVVQWRRGDGGLQTAQPSPGLLAERLWEALPIRKGSQYQNRRDQHGLYFWLPAGEHVWYESALELASLVELNYAGRPIRRTCNAHPQQDQTPQTALDTGARPLTPRHGD